MDTICGLRMLRRLGSGSRAAVHLAQPLDADENVPSRVSAVKVFHPETTAASISNEIDALSRLSSPFLLALRDLGTAPDGRPALVFDRIGPLTASQLVLERERIGAGEAVTILAPLTDAVGELWRAGVQHGRIRLDRVGFDEVGTPVLFGFGHATVHAGASGTAIVAEAIDPEAGDRSREDTIALAALARSVLERTGTAKSADLLAWLTTPVERCDLFRSELRERLFDLADAEPVMLTAPTIRAGSSRAARLTALASASDQFEADGAGPVEDWLTALHLPQWLHDLLPRRSFRRGPGGHPWALLEIHAGITSFFAPVRRPVWLAAGSVAALIVATLVITGVSGSGPPSKAAPVPFSRADATTESGVDDGAASASDSAPEAGDSTAPAEEAPASATEVRDGTDPAIAGEDPAAAAVALLRAREACIAATSVLCLDDVAQQGSAALEADAVLVRGLQEGAEASHRVHLAEAEATVIEHLGGSAIVSVTASETPDAAPVTALLVRGPEGWRIRDLIIG